jgi:hypothetical protein
MHRGDFMPENSYVVQEYRDTSCTYEIRAVFSNNVMLEEILVRRVIQNPETLDFKEETA